MVFFAFLAGLGVNLGIDPTVLGESSEDLPDVKYLRILIRTYRFRDMEYANNTLHYIWKESVVQIVKPVVQILILKIKTMSSIEIQTAIHELPRQSTSFKG